MWSRQPRLTMRPSIHLLKRSTETKLFVEHYAVGVGGALSQQLLGQYAPTILQLTPVGITREEPSAGWEVVGSAGDKPAAVARPTRALRTPVQCRISIENCEHFAREIVTGRHESLQVRGALLVAAILLLVVAISRAR